MNLQCIVEGKGEEHALPVLIRRIAPHVSVNRPWRSSKDRLLKDHELEREIQTVSELMGSGGAILVLLDADKHCPAVLGPKLLQRARSARPDREIVVAIAKAEFENWFLAAARSLRGKRGLPGDLEPPADPESVRGAKEWLAKQRGSPYSPTIDQPAFASLFDLQEARQNSPSFRRFERLLLDLFATGRP